MEKELTPRAKPAPDQEAVLDAFENAGWRPCIPNPLPRSADQNAKYHLQETIKSLNRRQQRRLIFFGGTRTRQLTVCWRYLGGA